LGWGREAGQYGEGGVSVLTHGRWDLIKRYRKLSVKYFNMHYPHVSVVASEVYTFKK
jgi:hypothetical protein